MSTHFFSIAALLAQRKAHGQAYHEFFRIPAMSAGVYVLRAGTPDLQSPHQQDELYYVVAGRAHMQVAEEHREVSPGSVIFVEAGVEHRFYDIAEDLDLLVFFAPSES